MKMLIAGLTIFLAAPAAMACEPVTAGGIVVEGAWSRASTGTQRPGVLYMTIRNGGASDDALLSISTPVAEESMLHETKVEDGVASMAHTMRVPLPAGEIVELRPGSYHGMLMGLTRALEKGASFPVTLTFEEAGELTVPVDVLSVRAEAPECDAVR